MTLEMSGEMRPVGGRYRPINLLGSGGMGRVYRAIDLTTNQVITLKTLKAPMSELEIALRSNRVLPGPDDEWTQAKIDGPQSTLDPVQALSMATIAPTVERMLPREDGDPDRLETARFGTAPGQAPSGDLATSPDLEITMDPHPASAIKDGTAAEFRLALAHEFEMLSTLRHPNVISVLDYGFDDEGQPYFTMHLVEGGKDFDQGGRDKPLSVQVDLLVQLLQALDYLHFRDMVHRDLKPGNVLVVGTDVRVLDFGLSMRMERAEETAESVGGTMAYIAPEIFEGLPPSPSSDLYAVGVMAYQLFSGKLPFPEGSAYQMIHDTLHTEPDLDVLDVPEGLRAVVGRLMAKTPTERYATAREAIAALGEATNQPIAHETAQTRESFLEWAPLVGRDAEMATLTAALDGAIAGEGGAYLLGGESGVGKTRLMDEVTIQAQVKGALLLRGQTESAGGDPYNEWREVCRTLCTVPGLSDLEVGVLGELVDDIQFVLDRTVQKPPLLDPAAARNRLFGVIEDIVLRQPKPVAIMLEDMHWARDASIALLTELAEAAPGGSLFILASYREEERELSRELPDARDLRLQRLPDGAVAELSRRVLGDAELPEELVGRLQKETEGNPFFLVEVLRSLAEDAGRLDQIAGMELPEMVLTGGIQQVLQIRLGRLTDEARPLADLAAITGREIDRLLLAELFPDADLDDWIDLGHSIALLENRDGVVRFAHDKLREELLAEMGDDERVKSHGLVAGAMETLYAEDSRYFPVLAYHWRQHGDQAKECRYTVLSGVQALHGGALVDAAQQLTRALEIVTDEGLELPNALTDPRGEEEGSRRWTRADIEAQLTETNFQMGSMEGVREHGTIALKEYGYGMPGSTAGWIVGIWVQIGTRMLQSMLPSLFKVKDEDEKRRRHEAMRVTERMSELYIYAEQVLQILWSGLKVLNLGNPIDSHAELARGYSLMAIVLGSVPLHGLAQSWADRGLELADKVKDPVCRISVIIRRAVYGLGTAQWDVIVPEIREALETSEALRDGRHIDECRVTFAKTQLFQGNMEEAAEQIITMYMAAKERGDLQIEGWGMLNVAENRVRQGRVDEVKDIFPELESWLETTAVGSEKLIPVGMMALAACYEGNHEDAARHSKTAVELAETTNMLIYWQLTGIMAAAEVHLRYWESGEQGGEAEWADGARKMAKALKGYARANPAGIPGNHFVNGWLLWVTGKQDKAVKEWETAIAEGERLGMYYGWPEPTGSSPAGSQSGRAPPSTRPRRSACSRSRVGTMSWRAPASSSEPELPGRLRPGDTRVTRCPACRPGRPLVPEDGALICPECCARWPEVGGLVRLYREPWVQGTDRLLRRFYDGLPSLHDPASRLLLPLMQSRTDGATREGWAPFLELDELPSRGDGGPVRILEVGIGGGANLPLLERGLPPGPEVEIWGLDLSLGMLLQCRRRLEWTGEDRVRLLLGDAHALPFADGVFDRVFHVGAAGSYREPALALAEMARVARPGTPIVVVDEQLDPTRGHGPYHRAMFRLLTFYDADPHCPVELLPEGAMDVEQRQVSRFYYGLRFRMPAGV